MSIPTEEKLIKAICKKLKTDTYNMTSLSSILRHTDSVYLNTGKCGRPRKRSTIIDQYKKLTNTKVPRMFSKPKELFFFCLHHYPEILKTKGSNVVIRINQKKSKKFFFRFPYKKKNSNVIDI